jgi:excisionase family DNA binding protein
MKSDRQPQPVPTDCLWTIAEVARYLRVHPKTVYKWVRDEGLPSIRIRSAVRFHRSDVLRWLAARKEV